MKNDKAFKKSNRSNHSKSNQKYKKGKDNDGFKIKKRKDDDNNTTFLLDEPEDNQYNIDLPQMKIAKHWEGKKLIETKNTSGTFTYLEDEQVILSQSNGTLLALSLDTLEIKKTYSSPNEEIISFAYNKQKREIICQMNISMIRIFNYDSEAQVNSFKLHKTIGRIIQIDPSCHFLAIVTSFNHIMIYDTKTFNLECTFTGHSGVIYDIAFNPIAEKFMLYSASEDGSVKIWNVLLKKCIKTLEPHTSSVRHIQLTNDGNFLISGTFDNKIFIWKLKDNFLDGAKEDKPKIFEVEKAFESMLYFTKMINKKSVPTLLLGYEDGTIAEMNLQEGTIIQEKDLGLSQPIVQIYYSSKLNRVMMLSSEQFLIYLDINLVTQDLLKSVCRKVYPCYCQELLAVKFLSTSTSDFIFSSNDSLLKYYNANEAKVSVFEGHSDFIMSVIVKENFIVTSSKDNTIKVWEWIYESNNEDEENEEESNKEFKCKCICLLTGHSETVNCTDMTIRKDKRIISGSKDGSIKLWDIESILSTKEDDEDDQEKTITESLYSHIAHEDEVNVIKFSPNEKLIASGSYDKKIKIFDNKLTQLAVISGHRRGITDLSFSPYAKVLVSSSTDKTIKMWNLTDYSCLNTLEGHLSSVLKVDWVYHGTHLISSGADGLIKFWNIKTSECINTIDGHEGKIWAMDVMSLTNTTEAALTFITGGTDSKVVLWKDISMAKEKELLLKEEEKLNKEDDLRLLNYEGDYVEALKLSLELNHKNNFLISFQNYVNDVRNKHLTYNSKDPIDIIIHNRRVIDKEIQEKPLKNHMNESNTNCLNEVLSNKEIRELVKGNIDKIIEIIRDYNLKLSTFFYAQVLLKLVLKVTKIDLFFSNKSHYGFRFKSKDNNEDEEDNNKKFNGKKRQRSLPKNYIENLQVIKMYSDKHLERLNREITKAYMIDYSIEKMKLV